MAANLGADTNMPFTVNASVNRIYLISSIPDAELQTTRRLGDDLSALCVAGTLTSIIDIGVRDKNEFLSSLMRIKNDCAVGAMLLVHIDCHARKQSWIQPASGDAVSWGLFIDSCRKINISCNNKLGIVLTACYGLYAITPITLNK